MHELPHACELPDGSLVVPPATRALLYRLLGDLSATLAWTHGRPVLLDNSHELKAIHVAQDLLLAKHAGPLPPLHQIMGEPPPRSKAPDLPEPPRPGTPLRRIK
jgi:hypothetical protein